MAIRLLFFSTLRDIVGSDELDYEIPQDGIQVADLLEQLFAKYDGLQSWEGKLLISVNCDYADANALVSHGDEVAIMPPVQGG